MMVRSRVYYPPEMEEEAETLFERYLNDNEGKSWAEYRDKYASAASLAYMQEVSKAKKQAKNQGLKV